MSAVSQAIFFGEKAVDTFTDADGDLVRMTEGYIPSIKARGNCYNYASTPNIVMFDDIVRILNKSGGSRENFMFYGLSFKLKIDDELVDQFRDGAITYGAFNGNQEKAMNLEFKSIQKGGYSFHFKDLDIFSHTEQMGKDGLEYINSAVVMPADDRTDSQTRNVTKSFCMRYKNYMKAGFYGSREWYKVWETGAQAKPIPTSEIDERKMNYQCEVGAQTVVANRHIYITKDQA
jgi:hypothetical protein